MSWSNELPNLKTCHRGNHYAEHTAERCPGRGALIKVGPFVNHGAVAVAAVDHRRVCVMNFRVVVVRRFLAAPHKKRKNVSKTDRF